MSNQEMLEEMRNDIKCYSPSFEDAVSHKGFNKHSQSEEYKEETGRVVGIHYNSKDLMNKDNIIIAVIYGLTILISIWVSLNIEFR